MKILFALSSPEYLRYYDTTIGALADRGHQVRVAVSAVRRGKPVVFEPAAYPGVTYDGVLPARDDRWAALARGIRGSMDFIRYLHPRLAGAAAARARMKRDALPRILHGLDRVRTLPSSVVTWLMRALAAAERVIPPDRRLVEYFEAHAPDLVLVSPLVEAASDQVDVVRAAQARGLPVMTLVASWDNLTNKGDLRVATDRVVVWNEAQKQEAIALHRVAPNRVVVTGSQVFDRWFDRRPSCDRDAFCRMVGLPPGARFVLYTGSSIFISRATVEVPFVRRWIAALRASSDPLLRDIGVLVRPHPYNGSAWPAEEDFAGLGAVAVWPRGGYSPVDEANRSGFFDSLYYADAVVGINTSAMIEAAVVGRPVFSILAEEFAASQEGMIHFRHLLADNGGCLRVASTFEEHARQLAHALRHPDAARADTTRFVESFVRPHGLDRACLPILVDAIEQHAASGQAAHAAPQLATRRFRLLLALAVAPVLAGTLTAAAFAVAEAAGRPPFTYPPPRNVAEAAGLGLEAQMLRMLWEGQDATRPLPVGAHVISSELTEVTALEAAVWTRSVRMMRLLQREGFLRSDAETRHIACVAMAVGAEDIVTYLFPRGLTGCDPERTIDVLQARAQ